MSRNAAATLSSALTRAAQWELIARNPYTAGAVLRPVLPTSEAGFWEPSEARTFIQHDAVREHPLFVACYLTLNLGLRLGELRGLQWIDLVDLRDRDGAPLPHLHVQRQAVDDRSIPTLTSRLKTRTSNRFIPLPRSTMALLEEWRLAQQLHGEQPELIITTERVYIHLLREATHGESLSLERMLGEEEP